MATLDQLCDCIGTQVQPQNYENVLYIGLEHLTSGRFLRIGEGLSEDVQSSKFAFEKDAVLYGKLRPYLDKAILADQSGICTTELLVLRPKPGVDPRFLTAVVHCPDFIAFAVSGTTWVQHPRTSWQHIKTFPLPDFSPSEQSSIATILWAAHDALLACENTIAAASDLKRAAMREVFTRGLRGEAQKQTEIGLVPESWEVKELGSIAEIAYGAQAAVANATDPNQGTLILTNVNIDLDGTINLEKRRYYSIPEKHKDRLNLNFGDVLFNWRSGSSEHIGKTAYFNLNEKCTYSSFILRFRCHRDAASEYLFRWLNYLRASGYFTAQRNVSSINSVYNASLSATIPVACPVDSEQIQIVTLLSAIDDKITLHKRKKAALEALFTSLLHQLMTGKIRVGDLDLSSLNAPQTEAA